MSERDALLRTIREHPEDDAPRLVFADWLDERTGKGAAADHEWAATIRQALDVVWLPRSDPRYLEVRRIPQPEPPRVAVQLLPQPLRRFATFSRGFADGLHISHRSLLKAVDLLANGSGPLHRLHLGQCRRHLDDVLRLPGLQQFRHLSFHSGCLNTASAASLADSPNLVNLTSLSLAESRLGSECVTAIVTSSHLTGLRELSFWHCNHEDADLAALASSSTVSNLERLALGSQVTPTHIEALARSPHLMRLQELTCPRMGATGWLRIVAEGGLPSLRRLSLDCGPDASSTLGEFVRSSRFATINALTVWGTLTQSAWQGVPDESGPADLRMRYLANSGDGFNAFVRSPMLGRCVELTVDNRQRLVDNIISLARSPNVRSLRYLRLARSYSTIVREDPHLEAPPEMLTALAESPHLANLVALSFGAFEIDSAALDILEGAMFAGSLRALEWAGCRVSANRLVRFAQSPAFGRLIALKSGIWRIEWLEGEPMLRERFTAPCYDW